MMCNCEELLKIGALVELCPLHKAAPKMSAAWKKAAKKWRGYYIMADMSATYSAECNKLLFERAEDTKGANKKLNAINTQLLKTCKSLLAALKHYKPLSQNLPYGDPYEDEETWALGLLYHYAEAAIAAAKKVNDDI